MCGIAGVIDRAGGPIDRERLDAANRSMRHRGPDGSGVHVDQHERISVGLAAVRLAVQDPTSAGAQPMSIDDGRYTIVFNGEVYNFHELRRELTARGRIFHTGTDTEVVACALAEWGTDALDRFDGMFALAFYDRKTRTGLLARDRYGIKPLLFSISNERLRFASEMRTLRIVDDWPDDIDNHALKHLLLFGFIPAPHTIYSHARRLSPGQFLRFTADSFSQPESFYRLPISSTAPAARSDIRSIIRERIGASVAARRVADVPIGAFLSGGMDSSIIVAHLSTVSPKPVETFAIGYADDSAYDETKYARLVAERFGTNHHEYRLTQSEILAAIPGILDHLGEPFGDSSIIPTTLVSRFARQHVTVALSGDGGDELFGGYWRYLGHEAIRSYQRLPAWLRRTIIEPRLNKLPIGKSGRWLDPLRQFRKLLRAGGDDPLSRHLSWARIIPAGVAIFDDEVATFTAALEHARMLAGENASADPLNAILRCDLQYALPDDMLHKVDIASMSHSLEVRVPLLDRAVVEAILPISSELKIGRGMLKRLLIDAYRDILPDPILQRRKKGFEVPIGEYLRGPLLPMFRDIVTRDIVESLPALRYNTVEQLLDDHINRRGEYADILFTVLSLCTWKRNA